MSNNTQPDAITFPVRCMSLYASSVGIDERDSFNFWIRSRLIRVICDKPFARGDILEISHVDDMENGVFIYTKLIEECVEEYPTLNFISGRVVYSKDSSFVCTSSKNIKIVKKIEQILNEDYSLGFVVLAYDSGKIECIDKQNKNYFECYINVSKDKQ